VTSATVSTVAAVSPTAATPDDAIRAAIKAAVDAGQFARAAKLLEVLRGV
jgi:hypothetical protein